MYILITKRFGKLLKIRWPRLICHKFVLLNESRPTMICTTTQQQTQIWTHKHKNAEPAILFTADFAFRRQFRYWLHYFINTFLTCKMVILQQCHQNCNQTWDYWVPLCLQNCRNQLQNQFPWDNTDQYQNMELMFALNFSL